MSNINVRRLIENIRSNTTIYTPVVEVIVNSIQAIEETGETGGRINIRVLRGLQTEQDDSLPEVVGLEIEDNGIGFTKANRDSFDTLYSDRKVKAGGKGFGRFTCLRYFEDLIVKSVYFEGGEVRVREFKIGKKNDIIVSESDTKTREEKRATTVTLREVKKVKFPDKTLHTIARHLVERLLPYFIVDGYDCPEIVLSESDGTGAVRLNDFFSNELSAEIVEVPLEHDQFSLESTRGPESFRVRVFKLYYSKNQRSRISLVADKREVSGSVLSKYIPEFAEEFFDSTGAHREDRERNFIVKAYVFSEYLDRNVDVERGGFNFNMESELLLGIAQSDIESRAADIAAEAVGSEITTRKEKKRARVAEYVENEAPWHRDVLGDLDLSSLPYNPPNEEIEARLQRQKFSKEVAIRRDVSALLAVGDISTKAETVASVVSRISENSKNDLTHYVALRRTILDLFAKSLERNEAGKYSSEGTVHDILFPRKGDTDRTPFFEHNLWILDERLNFTSFVSSDVPLEGGNSERPDLIVYNKRVSFRGDNEPSNPITIFEFKKPQRDDFANPSSEEDPVQQIVRYVNNIRDGKFRTPQGRKILVAQNTPFYGYVVCDLTPKVEEWLEREKDFLPMPDRLGWFQWRGQINLYIEVVAWDKVLRDANIRNRVFFQHLGI